LDTVFPGEKKLKRRLLLQLWKDMIISLVHKIFRSKSGKIAEKASEDSEK